MLAGAIHRTARRADAKVRCSPRRSSGNLGVLGYFKYYDFFVTRRTTSSRSAGVDISLELRSIPLPVGISFFTFQAISYVIDVYRGDFAAGDASQLRGVPLVLPARRRRADRAPGRVHAAARGRRTTRATSTRSRAFFLIVIGPLQEGRDREPPRGEIVDAVFGAPNQHSALEMLVGVYAYAVQIYADFSGYTDIAIGIALLLGFRSRRTSTPVLGDVDPGLLAPLAHDAVALASRLPVHPARREPRRHAPHVPQPHAHDAARRALARRRHGRSSSGERSTALRCASSAGGAARPGFVERPWTRGAPRVASLRDLPGRVLRVDLLPLRLVRGRAGTSSSGSSRRGASPRRS